MGIDEEALKRAADSLYSSLGPLDDLPPELRNTLANVYYKPFALARNITGFMKSVGNELANFEHAGVLVNSMRESRKHNKDIYSHMVAVTLDILKYNIWDAHKKTPLRRAMERKFKTPNEIAGLYERMEQLRNNDR